MTPKALETIPLLDLRAQYETLREEIRDAIDEVLASQQFILGPQLAALEEEVGQLCGTRFGIGVASGTDALMLALRACGVGSGDDVVMPAMSFIATAAAASQLGAKPVFVDIDPSTYNLDPTQLEARLTPKTRAIVPVHLYGLPAEMDAILKVAARRGIPVVEDNAQAIGASYRGHKTGSLGTAGCISFYPSKNLGAYGDAGMIVTSSEELAARLRELRDHGQTQKYVSQQLGWNSRLDEIQAAVLRVKLRHLARWQAARQSHAARYNDLLGRLPGVLTPHVPTGCEHVYHQYTVHLAGRGAHRERIRQYLAERGIATNVYYPVPLHLQPIYASLRYRRGALPVAELAAQEILSLPIYPELTPEQIECVAETLAAALRLT